MGKLSDWKDKAEKYTGLDVGTIAGYVAGGPVGAVGGGIVNGAGGGGGGGSEILAEKVLGGNLMDDMTGRTAADAAIKASQIAAMSQREQLDYLKEINAKPQEAKEQALTELMNMQTPEGQQAFIDKTKASPYYQELMGGMKAGEEAVARNTSQTGGLRSGNVQSALADHATQLQNRALTQSYGQGINQLNNMAGIGTNENQIGNVIGGIGDTRAAGITAAAGAKQQGTQNIMNTILGIGGMIL